MTVFPLSIFWVGMSIALFNPTAETELLDNDDAFLQDNDGAQLLDND